MYFSLIRTGLFLFYCCLIVGLWWGLDSSPRIIICILPETLVSNGGYGYYIPPLKTQSHASVKLRVNVVSFVRRTQENGLFTPLSVRKPSYHKSITQSFFHPPGNGSYQSLHYLRLSTCNRIKKNICGPVQKGGKIPAGTELDRDSFTFQQMMTLSLGGRDDCVRHLMTSLQLLSPQPAVGPYSLSLRYLPPSAITAPPDKINTSRLQSHLGGRLLTLSLNIIITP